MQPFLETEFRSKWADEISRLFELLSMHIASVERHTQAGSPPMIIEQYEELRDERLAELSELLRGSGLSVQFNPSDLKAA